MAEPVPEEQPAGSEQSVDPDGRGFQCVCPKCACRLEGYPESCPDCGIDLANTYSVTYRVRMPPITRTLAWILLSALALLLLLALVVLFSQILVGCAVAATSLD